MAERPDKLSLVVFSGDWDKVHYALVLASGAAAIEVPVTLFFTMQACRALTPDWRGLPTSGAEAAGTLDDGFKARNVAAFEELLQACVALGVKFLVCEMGLKAIDLERSALRDDVPVDVGGVVTFLNDASRDGSVMFV